MRRLLALLLCPLVLVLCREAFAHPAGSSTLTIWPVPALALTPGLTITLDGAPLPLEQLGKPVAVPPGEHVIRVTAPGRQPSETIVPDRTGVDGGFVILDVLPRTGSETFARTPGAAPSPGPEAPASDTSDSAPPLRIAGYALVAAGLAGATAGVALVIISPQLPSSSEEEIARAGWATTAAGAAVLLSGIVMAIAAPDETAPPASPAIVGFATPTSAGAALTMTF